MKYIRSTIGIALIGLFTVKMAACGGESGRSSEAQESAASESQVQAQP